MSENNDEIEDNIETREIKIDYDKLQSVKDQVQVLEGKLSFLTYFQQKAYNPETYKPEDKIKIKNEEDEDEYKSIPLSNFIRWRTIKEDGKSKIVSNAKLIEWSDGTSQLMIGDKFFDIMFSNMDNVRYGIKVDNNVTVINEPISKRMLITDDDNTNINEHAATTENIVSNDFDDEKSKVKLSYTYFDGKAYRKEDFSNRYSRRRNFAKDDKNLNKKRTRTPNK